MEDIRKQIAEEVYTSGWLERECIKVSNNHSLKDDLMMEVIMIILEFKPESSLQISYLKGQHLPFIKRIIMNNWNSVTSPFYIKYKKNYEYQLQIKEEITEDENGEEI